MHQFLPLRPLTCPAAGAPTGREGPLVLGCGWEWSLGAGFCKGDCRSACHTCCARHAAMAIVENACRMLVLWLRVGVVLEGRVLQGAAEAHVMRSACHTCCARHCHAWLGVCLRQMSRWAQKSEQPSESDSGLSVGSGQGTPLSEAALRSQEAVRRRLVCSLRCFLLLLLRS